MDGPIEIEIFYGKKSPSKPLSSKEEQLVDCKLVAYHKKRSKYLYTIYQVVETNKYNDDSVEIFLSEAKAEKPLKDTKCMSSAELSKLCTFGIIKDTGFTRFSIRNNPVLPDFFELDVKPE